MHVVCISRFGQSASGPDSFNARMADEFALSNHQFQVVDPSEISITHNKGSGFPLLHPEVSLDSVDLFHHALRMDDEWGWEIVACLRDWNKFIARPPRQPADDKVTIARLFAKAGISQPKTSIVSTFEQAKAAAAELGYPMIGKARRGSEGRTVRMIQNEEELAAFTEFCRNIAGLFVLQEVIKPLGRDIRAFVVGDTVVAAMERLAPEGDFRANYSISGKARIIELTDEEISVALKTAEIYKAPYAGVDIIRTDTGPVVLEINKAPALRGIEAVTGVNVGQCIVRYFETLVANNLQQ